jgi:hypothetical protein
MMNKKEKEEGNERRGEHHLSSVFYLHYEEIMTRAAKNVMILYGPRVNEQH